jgi:hypothetical protein
MISKQEFDYTNAEIQIHKQEDLVTQMQKSQ